MQNRKLSHRSFVTRPLGLERLQDRDLLAGNVSAFMDRGTLIVTGDIGDNELRITQVAPNWVQLTTMSSPTTINNNQSTATFKVTKGMIFNMGGGNDVLQFDGITMKQKNDLVVDMGIGDDNLQFNGMNVLRIRSILGEGHDSATVTNSKVTRSLNIFGAGGDDQITLANSKFGEKSVMDGNAGANFINQSNVKFGRKLQSLNMTFGTRPPLTPSQILTAGTDTANVDEGQSVEINVTANDVPTTGATLDLASLTITDAPDFGTTQIANGRITYTHNNSENFTDKIIYTIRDSSGRIATGTVNITIDSVNEKPTGLTMEKQVATGQSITFTVTATDAEGQLDADSTAIAAGAGSGSAIVNSDGSITYTHNGTTSTSDFFTYTIKDNQGNTSDPIRVNIAVVTNNTPPVANNDTPAAAVAEGGTATFNILANDTDTNGIDPKTVVITQPANGTVVDNKDGTVTFTHNGGETSTATFTYTVRDSLGTISNSATVTITITPVNDAPDAVPETVNATRNAATVIDVASNDVDPEDDLDLTSIEIVAGPAHGTAEANDDGTVTYTNNGNASATDSFTYRIKDAAGVFSDTVTVTINVSDAGNLAPIAEDDEDIDVNEGAAVTITVLSNDDDPDGDLDVGSVEIVTGPANGTAVKQANGTVIYTHNGSETLTDTFTYRVKDTQGLVSNVVTVTITITPVNDGPVAVPDAANVANGGSVTFSVSTNDTDPEGDDLDLTEVVIVGQPANGAVVENQDGTVTYTHNGSATTTDSFTYTIKDEFGAVSNTVTVTITIGAPVNDPPVAANDSATVDEGDDVVIDVAENDSDPEDDLDLGSIVQVTAPQNGTVTVNGDGTVTYTHDGSETTTDSFTYTITDGDGVVSNTATVTITIAPVNDLPVAVADAASVEDSGSVTINVAANDTDAEGALDVDSVALVSQGEHGTAVVNSNGTITYTHDGSEATTDSFTYTIADNTGAVSNVVTVTITIGAANEPPVGVNDADTVDEDGSVTIDVAANDSDSDGGLDLASIVIVAQGTNGTAVANNDGTITYTHDGSETISDSFTYTIQDNTGAVSNVVTVDITVTPVNDAPVGVDDADEVDEGGSVIVDAAANDTDAEGSIDLTSITIVGQGANGTAVANDDGTITYTHDGSNTTSDTFTYTIADDSGAVSNTVTVTITINPLNEAPEGVDDADSVDEGGSVNIDVAANDTDADGSIDLTSIEIVSQGANGTAVANSDGTITYTHNGSETASDEFTYTIKDDSGAVSNVVTVQITVDPVNDDPVANSDVADVDEGGTVLIDVASNDVDPENDLDLTSIEIDQEPLHGTLVDNLDGTVTYEHDGSESLSDTFSYIIRDADGAASGIATVTITIAPVNDAPLAVNEEITVTEDSGVNGSGNVLDNDSDPDGDALSVTEVDGFLANVGTDVLGLYGTFHINSDGTFTYDLDDTNVDVNALDDLEELIDSIAYSIGDGALTSTATLSVKILGNTD